nr:transposase [uncultured Rhodopila sp.]
MNATGGRRPRRSWSDEDKHRIVDEAVVPGASVADIARRHGVNANLVFNWRKAARAAAASVSDARAQGDARPGAAEACKFIPIGVLGRAEDGASALAVGSSPAVASETSSPNGGAARTVDHAPVAGRLEIGHTAPVAPSDFDRHFDLAVADAEQALVDSGSLAPMYLVVDRIGHGQLVEADNSTPERKTASMELVRLLAVAADAELVLSRAEAWIVLGDHTPGLAPSRSDRRREVVAVLASARINDTIVSRTSLREIVRAG